MCGDGRGRVYTAAGAFSLQQGTGRQAQVEGIVELLLAVLEYNMRYFKEARGTKRATQHVMLQRVDDTSLFNASSLTIVP